MLLPVVVRELQVRARSPATYYFRMAAAGLMVVLGGFLLDTVKKGGGAMPGGRSLILEILTYLLLIFCLLEGVRTAAGGIHEERREGTLGLLFLTDLSGFDVLLGKWSGAVLHAVYAVLAMLPVLAVAVLFGGVSGAELVRLGAALLVSLALSLACGVSASVGARDAMGSILVALGMVVAICFVPLVAEWMVFPNASPPVFPREAWISLPSPLTGFALVPDPPSGSGSGRFWSCLGVQVALTAALVSHSAWRLQRTWRRDGDAAGRATRSPGSELRTSRLSDPLALTFERRLNLPRWRRALLGLTLLLVLGGVVVQSSALSGNGNLGFVVRVPIGVMGLTRILLLIWLATRVFGEARHSGELEILLTTPVSGWQWVGQFWSRLSPVLWGMVAMDAVGAAGVMILHAQRLSSSFWSSDSWRGLAVHFATNEVVGAMTWWAMVWVALWYGVSSRRLPMAAGKTFGLVVVGTRFFGAYLIQALLQTVLLKSTGSGFSDFAIVLMGAAVFQCLLLGLWIAWARRNLFSRFRQAAAEVPGGRA